MEGVVILGLNKNEAALNLIDGLEEVVVLDDVVDGVVEMDVGADEYKESTEDVRGVDGDLDIAVRVDIFKTSDFVGLQKDNPVSLCTSTSFLDLSLFLHKEI